MLHMSDDKNEKLARAGARILRFTSMKGAVAQEDCSEIVTFASCLLHKQPCDYEMLLRAQSQINELGGDSTLLDDIKEHFVH
jgi:hypothetical protein